MGVHNHSGALRLFSAIPKNYAAICSTKSNVPTLHIGNGYAHSRYDPVKEANRTLQSPFFLSTKTHNECLFFGLGLGYVPELYMQQHPSADVTIIEPDLYLFLFFLAARPLKNFFAHPHLSLLIGITAYDAFKFLQAAQKAAAPCYRLKPIVEANAGWFAELTELLARNTQKDEINKNTLKKFGTLWLKNLCKNMSLLETSPGITALEQVFRGCPALVIAAGPSLTEALAYIASSKPPAVIIATDTALKACLRAGIHPDFVLLFDPQYWNFLHIAGAYAPHTILVTDITVYPPAVRKKFKALFLTSPAYPLGKFIESRLENKGHLEAGGSVATTAWDFARFLGASEIIVLGLDLGFPERRTHFLGSTFEERNARIATRLIPSETRAFSALYAARPEYRPAHANGCVLTDKRMLLYSWWFETHAAQTPSGFTSSFLSRGIIIPGINNITQKDFLTRMSKSPLTRAEINSRIQQIVNTARPKPLRRLDRIVSGLLTELTAMQNAAREALHILHSTPLDTARLDRINQRIRTSAAKELISSVLFLLHTDESALAKNSGENLYCGIIETCTVICTTIRQYSDYNNG